MSMSKFERLRLSLAVCVLILPAAGSAQSLLGGAIKAGTLKVTSTSSRPVLALGALSSGAVDVESVFDDGGFDMEGCRPCLAGTFVGVGGRIAAAGKGNAFYEADFMLTGTPVQIPAGGIGDLTLTTPFTLEGTLIAAPRRGAAADEKEPPGLLEGSGTVTLRFSSSINPDTGERLYFFQDATYQFSPVNPSAQ